jgi:hypothetical protein
VEVGPRATFWEHTELNHLRETTPAILANHPSLPREPPTNLQEPPGEPPREPPRFEVVPGADGWPAGGGQGGHHVRYTRIFSRLVDAGRRPFGDRKVVCFTLPPGTLST